MVQSRQRRVPAPKIEEVYLRVTTYKKSHPGFARHFYGTVRQIDGKVILEVLQTRERNDVIEKAKRGLVEYYPGRKFKLVVHPETKDL